MECVKKEALSQEVDEEQDEMFDENSDSNDESSPGTGIVERIVDVRQEKRFGTIRYLVKWEGFPEESSSWEPESNLKRGAALRAMLEEFKKSNAEKMAKIVTRQRTKRPIYDIVPEEEPDSSQDGVLRGREIKEDDEVFGKSVGQHKGEVRRLLDPSHKTSLTELQLAKMNTGRLTRRQANMLLKAEEKRDTPSPASTVGSEKRKTRRGKKAKEVEEPLDDLFTTGDDMEEKEEEEVEKRPVDKKKERKRKPQKTKEDSSVPSSSNVAPAKPSLQISETVNLPPLMNSKKTTVKIDLSGLPDFPIRSHINDLKFPNQYEHDPLDEPPGMDTVLKYIKMCDEIKVARATSSLTRIEKIRCYNYHEKQTNANLIHMILRDHPNCGPFHQADGIIRDICYTIYNGVLKEQMNGTGNTPLHIAAEQERVCTMQVLLNYHPDLLIKNNKEQTPLDIAYEKNNYYLVRQLLEAGANFVDIERKDKIKNKEQKANKYQDRQEKTASSALNQYTSKLAKVIAEARDKFLIQSKMRYVLDASPTFQQAGYNREVFQLIFNFTPYHLPSYHFQYLLFIYVIAIKDDVWTARCWNKFPLNEAPKLNGRPLHHCQDSEYPMIFYCPLQKGINKIDIIGNCSNWRDFAPHMVAQVIMVDGTQVEPQYQEADVRLEQVPLVGPLM